MTILKNYWVLIVRSILITAGVLWLPLEAYEGLDNTDASVTFGWFVAASILVGIIFFVIDGFYISGFLKKTVTIESNTFNSKIRIEFGDLFGQDGWKAIGVNDFFDSTVDDDLVSASSLHGQALNKYWGANIENWREQVSSSLDGLGFKKTNRENGNIKRYPIGTTATAEVADQKFLFVAFGRTKKSNNVVSANAESVIRAVRGMLQRARVVCANEPIYIPLIGSGLGRVGIKNTILVHLILAAIFEESQDSKISDSITIILPKEKYAEVNIGAIARDWK